MTLILAWAVPATSQRQPPAGRPRNDPQFGRERNQQDEREIRLEKERAKSLTQARHVALKRDTDKLLDLATELKQYVDKTNENTLSLDVVKKAEEIEKLAKSVKEKMKGT